MDSKQLRIGNYVLADYDEVEVLEVYQEQIRARKLYPLEGLDDILIIHLQNVHPIPLDAELLVKCGFVKDGTCFKYGEVYRYYYSGESAEKYFWAFNTPVGWVAKCDYRLKYLHQLQNLYYVLTGSDLPVTL